MKLVILTGPTAVGKTSLSIDIAKEINASIISADSMQIYEYMDIGSAKINKEEMQNIKHYMIDEVKPDFSFSVSEFQKRAKNYIKEIQNSNKNVIITGGTGLYLNSLIYEMDFANSNSNNYLRDKLQKELYEKGIDYMHNKLRELDHDSANRIHKNNTKRVIRAIEVSLSGNKMNDFSTDLKLNKDYDIEIIILDRDRQHLYQRINERVDKMFESGLIDEVKKLLSMGYTKDLTSMQGIGYKEVIKYLENEYSLQEATEIIKRDSRRYAKRQLTWFRKYKEGKWFNLDEYKDYETLKKDILLCVNNFYYK